MNLNHPALIITGIAAVVVLAGILAWRSVRSRHIARGGSLTWTLLSLKWTVPAPPADVVTAAAEQPVVTGVPEWKASGL